MLSHELKGLSSSMGTLPVESKAACVPSLPRLCSDSHQAVPGHIAVIDKLGWKDLE